MPFPTYHPLIRFAEVDVVPVSVVEGQNLRYCGIGAGYDDVVITGDLDELKVRASCVATEKVR